MKNVNSLVSVKKNIHTQFGMQIDDAQSHGNHLHKHVSYKWILTIMRPTLLSPSMYEEAVPVVKYSLGKAEL